MRIFFSTWRNLISIHSWISILLFYFCGYWLLKIFGRFCGNYLDFSTFSFCSIEVELTFSKVETEIVSESKSTITEKWKLLKKSYLQWNDFYCPDVVCFSHSHDWMQLIATQFLPLNMKFSWCIKKKLLQFVQIATPYGVKHFFSILFCRFLSDVEIE